ncbi:PREDICTED: sulfotransferase family cytosolic 1B member 1-like [Wasmannia auropunctata]|uniref:sulfotransferase family cytosolic 1B member 1-like n=1 Tax=Wasmannia auropunctata TaxID=64793 RepID=UPI0005EF6356|nr:PREDICTED: sulfotransferase family cytosolic 1B member 1-like [Wasmannia auropunctata]
MSFKNLKVERVEGELAAALTNRYPFHKRGFIKVGQKKWFLPYRYAEDGGAIYEFEIRPDDTWIVTYPRSGTTMTQELIWLVANDMNFDEAYRKYLVERFPFIELGALLDEHIAGKDVPGRINMDKNTAEFVQNQPLPRFIKSHMPFELLPTVVNSTCKIIYVARNPRDVVVSWYHFQKTNTHLGFQGTFEQFCNNFMSNHTMYSPYWEHVKEAWAMKHRENMMFLFYEDLIKDLPGNIRKITAFFDKSYSDEQIAKLVEHLKIENFRKNPMVNQLSSPNVIKPEMFIRQGMTGSWKEMFTPEIEEKFNKWITDNLKDTDLIFPS